MVTGSVRGVLMAFALAAALAASAQAGPAQARQAARSESAPCRLDLPTSVRDVTGRAHRTPSPADEVVVTHSSGAGLRACILELDTAAAAQSLAAHLAATPGTTAAINRTVAGPPPATTRSISALSELDGNYEAQLWGINAIGAPAAWATTRGAGTLVAVLDTGVDPNLPDLAGRLSPQVDLVNDGVTGDSDGHGTHVAGIIGAAGDGMYTVGVAPEVQILPIRVGTSDGATLGALVAGIQAAVTSGAGVINISMGGMVDDPTIRSVVNWAASRGVTLVAAAGNEYNSGNPVEYPAAYPQVIAVASAGQQPDGQLFGDPDSTTGPQVDIVAPGDQILSLAPMWTGKPITEMTGTSMASPHVAGVAALVRSANPGLRKDQIDQAIMGSAQVVTPNGGWTPYAGFGLVRADQAVAAAAGTLGPLVATAKVWAYRNRLRVDIDPDLPGYWQFIVQRQDAAGNWSQVGRVRRTRGSLKLATIKLPRGSYRVQVLPRLDYAARDSGSVQVAR